MSRKSTRSIPDTRTMAEPNEVKVEGYSLNNFVQVGGRHIGQQIVLDNNNPIHPRVHAAGQVDRGKQRIAGKRTVPAGPMLVTPQRLRRRTETCIRPVLRNGVVKQFM